MIMLFKIFKPLGKVSAVAALILLGSVQVTFNSQESQGWVATSYSEAAADSNRRGKARFGGLSGRWRLAFMLMRTKRNLRTSATRAFFFPKMSRRGRITHRPSR